MGYWDDEFYDEHSEFDEKVVTSLCLSAQG